MSLLAGKSWVNEVEEAISSKTFRFLAILSKNSIKKENPSSERTKAAAVAKANKLDDFIITANLDGITASEIPWTLVEKSYADFSSSWAVGLSSVLKALSESTAPCDQELGASLVCQWTSQRDQAAKRNEKIWTNLFNVISIPKALKQFEVKNSDTLDEIKYSGWPVAIQTSKYVWSFTEPPANIADKVIFERSASWMDDAGRSGLKLRNYAWALLRRSIEDYCISKGLVRSEDGKSLYFPKGLSENDKHSYIGIYEKKTYLKFVGKSTFRLGPGKSEVNHHHLAPSFKLIERRNKTFQVQVINRVYLTNEDGTPIHPTRMVRRRKKVCKNWWNDKWCARLLALASWMSDGKDEIEIFNTGKESFKVSGMPMHLNCEHGIAEGADELFEEYPDSPVDDIESSNPITDYSDIGGDVRL